MASTAPTSKFRHVDAFYTFPCGTFCIQQEDNCIVSVQLVSTPSSSAGNGTRLTDTVAKQLDEYFQGKRHYFDVPYQLRGTPFQKRVWAALCQIPYGQTRSYGEVAAYLGNPKACRAVGMANHRNPLMIVIPCHRVIASDGSLGGYAGGLHMKEFLLNLEKIHTE